MSPVTICAECKHFRAGSSQWYDQYCGAVEREPAIDYQTGQVGYAGCNDLGTRYVTHHKRPHARTINTDGCCKLFEVRG